MQALSATASQFTAQITTWIQARVMVETKRLKSHPADAKSHILNDIKGKDCIASCAD